LLYQANVVCVKKLIKGWMICFFIHMHLEPFWFHPSKWFGCRNESLVTIYVPAELFPVKAGSTVAVLDASAQLCIQRHWFGLTNYIPYKWACNWCYCVQYKQAVMQLSCYSRCSRNRKKIRKQYL